MKRIGALCAVLVGAACGRPSPTIEAYCAAAADGGQGCVESWSDAQSSGSRFCASGAAFLDVTFKTCAGANVAILGALGTPRIYFYSAASGSLVGIEDLTSTGAKVVAGFVPHVALSACSQIGTMACPTPP